jgi:hypothetical protein
MKYWRPPELEPIAKPEDRRTDRRDLITLIAIGVIGCLISISLTLYFPDLGLTVEQFNPFAGP